MIGYLDRDLLRTFAVTFIFLMLFVQVGIFVSFLMNMYSDIFGSSQNKFLWFLLYYVFSLPRQLTNTIPAATAVSVLVVYTVKARQNEILAFLVGGVSPMRLARPMLLVTLLFSIGSYAMTELLANAGDAEAERIKRVIIEERSEDSITREKKLFQKGQGDRFYMVRSFQPSRNQMDFPYILDLNEDWKSVRWTLEAQSAELIETEEGDEWSFSQVTYRGYNQDGSIADYRQMPLATETEILPAGVRLENELTRYIRQRWRPSQMNIIELRDYIELFKLQNKPTYQLETHLHFNIATAFGCFILSCLMVGHILRPASAGVLMGFGGGLILIAAYYIAFLFARNASEVGTIPAWVAAHGINMGFLAIAVVLLKRNSTA